MPDLNLSDLVLESDGHIKPLDFGSAKLDHVRVFARPPGLHTCDGIEIAIDERDEDTLERLNQRRFTIRLLGFSVMWTATSFSLQSLVPKLWQSPAVAHPMATQSPLLVENLIDKVADAL